MRFGETVRDAGLLLMAGFAFGLVANAISPRGIALRRDYFAGMAAPASSVASRTVPASVVPATSGRSTPPAAPPRGMTEARRTRLAARGIDVIELARAAELFHDARHAAGRILFVDARDLAHFQAGHIRGARQLDHYHLERYIADVLGACALAEEVVVYCNGGECEDSELAAGDLLQLGVPATKLHVYAGGITEWQARGLPVASDAQEGGAGSRP